ncbi:MAG: prepilin-type N-terminal cleavage/methylation domain-containing protein [Candidatus Omnitrophota bacterium]
MHKKGFTLVELLVVIVIIVILSAILLPGVNRAMKNAKVSQAQSEMAQFEMAYRELASRLPVFYYCRLEDLLKPDPAGTAGSNLDIGGIRIWASTDTSSAACYKGLSDSDLQDTGTTVTDPKRSLYDAYFEIGDTASAVEATIRRYWREPVSTWKKTTLTTLANDTAYNVSSPFTQDRKGYRPLDPWERPYRMFWYTDDNTVTWDAEITDKVVPKGATGTMVIISAGPDGVFQSLVADTNWKTSPKTKTEIITISSQTAHSGEGITPTNANQSDFANFNPFHPNITEADPYYTFNVGIQ